MALERKSLTTNTSVHFLATLQLHNVDKLVNSNHCHDALHEIVKRYSLQNLGVLIHNFENKSFSLVIVLAESHISIHTWPEHRSVQLDVFLCNYKKNNKTVAQKVFQDICDYFEPHTTSSMAVERP